MTRAAQQVLPPGHAESTPAWRWVLRGVALLAVAGALLFVWSAWDQQAIVAWKRSANPLAFFAAMSLLPAIGAPITPFYMLAGATFGVRTGLIGTAIAVALNLSLCHWLARGRMRRRLQKLMRRFNYKLPDFEQDEGAFRFTLVVKLAPGLPGFLKNYVLALAGVPFALYFGISFAIALLYALPLLVLGDSLISHDAVHTLIAGGIILLVLVGLWWWRERRARANEAMP